MWSCEHDILHILTTDHGTEMARMPGNGKTPARTVAACLQGLGEERVCLVCDDAGVAGPVVQELG